MARRKQELPPDKMNYAFRYRMYPTKEQEILIQKTFGCCRKVWNLYLGYSIEIYEQYEVGLNEYDWSKALTQLKRHENWKFLNEPASTALRKELEFLGKAYQKFFNKKAGFPNFKSKKNPVKSFTMQIDYNEGKVVNNRIQLPKLGKCKVRNPEKDNFIPYGKINSATITQEADGKYYVSLNCVESKNDPLPKTGKVIGIDLGLKDYATLSDGTKIENPRFYRELEPRIKEWNKIKSRRQMYKSEKGYSYPSKRREKARLKAAKLHAKQRHQREYFLQNLTTSLVREYDIICIEDLSVKEMMEKGNTGLSKSIGDAGWYRFKALLDQKCKKYDKRLIKIPRFEPSSQLCSECGYKNEEVKDLSVREWTCPHCGAHHDRDVNAAKNILKKGLEQI